MANTPERGNSQKLLTELRVIDLKTQLESRGLEKTGVKPSLIDRLRKVCLLSIIPINN